jgi:hypothetical protein
VDETRTDELSSSAAAVVIIQPVFMKGNGVATLAQNKIFPAKQELLLSEITGLPLDAQMQRNRLDVDERVEGRLPLDAQMQRNRLDVDERVEGSRQCSCSRPS